MGVTRYTEGGVTVTLDGADEVMVRQLLEGALGGCLAVMEREAEAVALAARREWYGPTGVTRITGKGGDIVALTTVDTAKDEVRVSVGSTDDRTVRAYKKGNGRNTIERTPSGRDVERIAGGSTKPLPVFQHSFWSTTLRAKAVSREEWFGWQKKKLPVLPPPDDPWWKQTGKNGRRNGIGLASGKWYILRASAPEGHSAVPPGKGFLLAETVLKPTRAAVKRITPQLGAAIAERMRTK
jgi:hypothetical protein